MPPIVLQLIITLVICGFLYWVWLKISPLLPIAEPFASIINVLIVILIGAIIIFYVVIPLLQTLGHMSLIH